MTTKTPLSLKITRLRRGQGLTSTLRTGAPGNQDVSDGQVSSECETLNTTFNVTTKTALPAYTASGTGMAPTGKCVTAGGASLAVPSARTCP